MHSAVASAVGPALGSAITPPPSFAAGAFNPTSLFAASEPGWDYDVDDLSTMFLEGSGPTQAVVNGLVGLHLDKRLKLARGAETRQTGAVGLLGAAAAATYDTATGAGSVTRVDATNQSYVSFTGLTPNTFHVLEFSAVSGTLTVRLGNVGGTTFAVFAAPRVVRVPSDAAGTITITAVAAGTVSFTLASVQPEAGLHRYTLTTSNKPILRGTPVGPSLMTNGDFSTDLSGWTTTNDVVWNAGKARLTNGGTVPQIEQQVASNDSSVRLRLTTTLISGTRCRVRIRNFANTGDIIGATYLVGSGTFEFHFAPSGGGFRVVLFADDASTQVDVDDIDARDEGPSNVTAPYALQYDGVDDFLQTASADFTGTDAVTVCVGVRKLSDAAAGVLAELGPVSTTTNGTFGILAPASASSTVRTISRGTAASDLVYTNAAVAAPVTAILSFSSDVSLDANVMRVNGVQVASSAADQGTGNYIGATVYFGRRSGTSTPFNGLEFSSVGIGRALTAAELSNLERWVAQRTGVTL